MPVVMAMRLLVIVLIGYHASRHGILIKHNCCTLLCL